MDEVVVVLWMLLRIIECYVLKVLNFGDVKVGIIGRLVNSVVMYLYVEFLIMEVVFEYFEKMLLEIVYSVYV